MSDNKDREEMRHLLKVLSMDYHKKKKCYQYIVESAFDANNIIVDVCMGPVGGEIDGTFLAGPHIVRYFKPWGTGDEEIKMSLVRRGQFLLGKIMKDGNLFECFEDIENITDDEWNFFKMIYREELDALVKTKKMLTLIEKYLQGKIHVVVKGSEGSVAYHQRADLYSIL